MIRLFAIGLLRTRKATLEPDAYYGKLEQILRQLAHIFYPDTATP